jgi:hypothetical protein
MGMPQGFKAEIARLWDNYQEQATESKIPIEPLAFAQLLANSRFSSTE